MSTVATLYDELDNLRNNICHECKKRLLAPGSVSDPATSPSQNASIATSSSSEGPPIDSGDLANSEISRAVPATSLSTSETMPDTTLDTPVTNPGLDLEPPKPKSELSEFSVEYNPEVKRTFDLHLEHVLPHESRAWCVKISPDGQRMAVGLDDSGATIMTEVKTKLNVWLVSEFFYQ